MTAPWLFLLAVLTLLGTPGPTNTLLATSGAAVGIRRSLPLLLGELGGYLVAIGAIRLVLAPVIAAQPLIGIGLRIVVAIYLIWIAVRLWTRASALAGTGRSVTVASVFTTTLLNPKAIIFALSIIPPDPGAEWHLLAFAATVPLVGFCWIVVGRVVDAAAGRERKSLVQRAASVALIGFAGLIAASAFG